MARRFEPDEPRILQRTYFKAWRKHRGFTQEQVAERIRTTKTRVSLKERGLEPYDQYYLEALAVALGTTTGSLLERDPKAEADGHALLDALKPDSRTQALAVIRALKIADEQQVPPTKPAAPHVPHQRKSTALPNARKVSTRETFN